MLARGLIVTLIACSSSSTTSPPNGTPAKRDAASADAAVPDSSLGALTFQVTEGSPAARAHFMRGLAALHSFWYDEASREFQAAIDADPKMNMAYWGAAMSKCKLLWGDDDLAAAKAFLAKMPDPDHVSPREQEWILALVELLDADDVRTSRQKFLTAMEALNQSWPDDETATFLSIALLSTIRPEDPDPTPIRKRAAALAAGVFAHNPKHPGAAHYLIHAY
ncbi:MAG TPA: tetratricopeptide repeat protein, partial [Kofleriaceae bacterium]